MRLWQMRETETVKERKKELLLLDSCQDNVQVQDKSQVKSKEEVTSTQVP